MSTITTLKAWLNASTTAEKQYLADRVKTSTQYLNHLAADETKAYKREASPELAREIEHVTKEMARASKGRLPIVWRTDLASACRACEFARRCLGDTVVASHFPVVVEDPGSEGGTCD